MIVTTVAVLLALGSPPPVVLVAALVILLVGAVAARRVTANLLAGLGLLIVRPYQRGERVRLHTPDVAAVLDAEVVRIGLLNTTLATTTGVETVPNTRLLRTPPDRPSSR
ncbi:mechanosensitive ion channel domain-containing protein [Jatrophihabitans endophyticus]|uniref:mechanosensitive ion channel domain-containing protein n=1 Tax=Jatrophihabitans endophyticus TaxID=1206085 RepID=UPI0013563B01|nr:mechanosensitive ion channel domain-containing protein [Jatrophihabitans endophyticus]